MPDPSLDALRPSLLAIAADDVYAPAIPMAVVLQEANDLLALVRTPRVQERLARVGVSAEAVARLELAISAARAAQSEWTVLRDGSKSGAQREREQSGEALRLELLAAARWSLRDDRVALGTLSAISEGEGVADLIQDLNDLAELVARKRAAFDQDKTFDAGASIERARSLASELAAGVSAERLSGDQRAAKDLRDRAYSQLDGAVTELREAGRYAFRQEESIRSAFASRFLRRKRRAGAGAAADAETPVLPSQPG